MLSKIKQKPLLKDALMPTTFIATFATIANVSVSLLMLYATILISGFLIDHSTNDTLKWAVHSGFLKYGFYFALAISTLTLTRIFLAPHQNWTKWMIIGLSIFLKFALLVYTVAEVYLYCEVDITIERKALFSLLKALVIVILFTRLDKCLVRTEQ